MNKVTVSKVRFSEPPKGSSLTNAMFCYSILAWKVCAIVKFHLLSLYQSLSPSEGQSYPEAFDCKEVCTCLPEHLCQWIGELIHNDQLLQQITFQADVTFSKASDYARP